VTTSDYVHSDGFGEHHESSNADEHSNRSAYGKPSPCRANALP
jgi:hypothetical protein